VPGLTTDERYAEAAHDVRLFLDGRRHDLVKSLEQRMATAAEKELYEQAAAYRDSLRTLEDIEERQRIASAQGDDTDVLAYYAEPPLVAANLFHLRAGRVVDRREFYWEDLEEFHPAEFVPALLNSFYLEAEYLPKAIHVPKNLKTGNCSKNFSPNAPATKSKSSRRNAAPKSHSRSRQKQRRTFFHPALPRSETKLQSYRRSVAKRAQSSRRTDSN